MARIGVHLWTVVDFGSVMRRMVENKTMETVVREAEELMNSRDVGFGVGVGVGDLADHAYHGWWVHWCLQQMDRARIRSLD